jgi:hypothetical protein
MELINNNMGTLIFLLFAATILIAGAISLIGDLIHLNRRKNK